MNAFEIATELFDSLKTGQVVRVSFASCMASGSDLTLKVGRRSSSAKYSVDTVALDPADGRKVSKMARVKLCRRANGRVSLAFGDMATTIKSFEIL